MFCSRKHGHRWRLTVAAAVATLACLLASAGSALAISAPIQISGTDGEGVLIQSEPNGASTSGSTSPTRA